MGIEQLSYPRPTELFLFVERKPVEGTCPRCKGGDLRRYPILRFNGWFIGVKCQGCFYTVRLDQPTPADRWPPFRSATRDWPAAPSEGGKLPSGANHAETDRHI